MIYLPVEMNRNGTAYSYFSKKAGKAKTNNREVPGKLWCLCDYWWGVSFSAEQSGAVQFFLNLSSSKQKIGAQISKN